MKGVQAERVYSTDWGIMPPLRILNHGALPLDLMSVWRSSPQEGVSLMTADYILENADPRDPESHGMKRILAAVSRPDDVFVGHTKAWENWDNENGDLVKLAGNAGYRQEMLATVPDRFGRTVFEVYHFVRK
jgi:hypothetical protein